MHILSAAPHMGSAYTTIAVDTAARFQRLAGKQVTMVTGTDEHGEKIAAAAAAKGLSPQQHCDTVAVEFQRLWEQVRFADYSARYGFIKLLLINSEPAARYWGHACFRLMPYAEAQRLVGFQWRT